MAETSYPREEVATNMVKAIYESFTDNIQSMAFMHGSHVATDVVRDFGRDMPLLDAVKLAVEIPVSNPVTGALRDRDEFALGAMLTFIEGRRGVSDV